MSQNRGPFTILMADDDEEDCMLAKEAWEENRLANELRIVENGEELLEYLQHRGKYAGPADSPTPGLILLGLAIPQKDRREALRQIKVSTDLRRIPIVALITSEAEVDIIPQLRPGGQFLYQQTGHLRRLRTT